MKKYVIPVIVGGVVLIVAGFFGGMAVSKRAVPGGPGGDSFPFGGALPMEGSDAARGGGMTRGGGGVNGGEILFIADGSLTIKLPDGGSKTVYVSGATTVTESVAGSVADLSVGNQVAVTGTANDDGSMTATMIDVRPTAADRAQE